MSTKLQNIEAKAISELALCNTKTKCKALWSELMDELKSYSENPSLYTIKKTVSNIRKGLEQKLSTGKPTHKKRLKWLLYDQVLRLDEKTTASIGIVSVGKEIAKEIIDHSTRSRQYKQSNKHHVTDMKGMISEAERMLNSWDWKQLATAIALLTGRRTIEVMKTGKIVPQKGNFARFYGQAKTKNGKPYIIPTLTSPSKIRKALDRLREVKPCSTIDNERVNNIAHSSIEKVCIDKFEGMTDKFRMYRTHKQRDGVEQEKKRVNAITAHDLRKIYTTYCVNNVLGNNNIIDQYGNVINSERLFVQSILGHDTTKTGEHYEHWTIKG